MPDGKTKRITGYLVVDWRKESLRARKTEPTQSELGSNELVGDLDVTVTLPEIDVPTASAEFEVPEPMVENAMLEALDERSFTDWEKMAESEIAERIDAIREAEDDRVGNLCDGIVVSTLRAARGRPDVADVEEYVTAAVGEVRNG